MQDNKVYLISNPILNSQLFQENRKSFEGKVIKKSFRLEFLPQMNLEVDSVFEELNNILFIKQEQDQVSDSIEGNVALEYLSEKDSTCVFVRNRSTTHRISVTTKVYFQYGGEWKEQYKTTLIKPEEKVLLGITHWKGQKFSWSIIRCRVIG